MVHFRLALLIILITLTIYVPHHLLVLKQYTQHISYIKDIQTIEIPKQEVQLSLDVFNNMRYNKIVNYSGYRPIVIKEVPKDSLMYLYFKDRLAGLAWAGLTECTIYLNPDLIQEGHLSVYTTTIHEYLHCLGYNHVDNTNDLMYYSSSDATISSVEGYAEVLYDNHVKMIFIKYGIEDKWNSIKSWSLSIMGMK